MKIIYKSENIDNVNGANEEIKLSVNIKDNVIDEENIDTVFSMFLDFLIKHNVDIDIFYEYISALNDTFEDKLNIKEETLIEDLNNPVLHDKSLSADDEKAVDLTKSYVEVEKLINDNEWVSKFKESIICNDDLLKQVAKNYLHRLYENKLDK